jgi:hypothetical protein
MEKSKIVTLGLALFLCGLAQASPRLILEEIAGTYEGWRTETTPEGTIHYEEMDEILPDGSFYTWLVDENGVVYTMFSILTLDEEGNIEGPYAGILKISGRHLSINYHEDGYAVRASTHR